MMYSKSASHDEVEASARITRTFTTANIPSSSEDDVIFRRDDFVGGPVTTATIRFPPPRVFMPDDADKDDQTVTYNRLKSQARVVFARGPWIESHPLSPNKNNRCYKTLAYGGNNCIIGGTSTIETVSGMIFPSSSSSLAYLHDDPSSFSTKVKEDHCSINRRISVVAFGGRRISFLSGGGLWTSHFNNKDRSVDTQVEDFASIPIAKTDSLTCSYLELSDWIHDARLLKIQMQQEENIEYAFLLAMGMANNNCEIFGFHCKATSDEQEILLQPTRLQCITCDVRCMLYSLSFHGGWDNTNVLSSSDAKLPSLIVASGTVFSEIVVWDAIVKSQEDNDGEERLDEGVKKWLTNITAGCANNITASRIRRRSLKRLKGHLGSIFSVHFSPCGRYIASTSDDRTVRLFQMQPAMDKLDMQWQLIWSGWGHTARVFDVSFAYPSFGDGEIISSHPILVSAGEDRTTRLWSPLQAKEVAHPLRGHDCESVWTVDVCEGTIVTGGNDGCVKLWELGSHIQKGKDIRTFVVPNDPLITTTCSTETTTTDTTATKPRKKQKKKAKTTGQLICGMELYSDHMLVVATRAGGLFSLDMKSSIWTKHKFWHHDVISSKDKSKLNIDPKTGACISVSPSAEHAIVGTTEGWLIVLSLDSPCGSSIHNERYAFHCQSHRPVQSISWIDNDNIVVFYARGSVIWFKMGKDPVPLHVMVLGTPGIPLSFAYDQQSIYIGDSRGNLAHFDISQSCENEIRPKSVLKAHKKEHVTAITVMESTGIIVSVGNDGCVQKSKVVNGELKRLIFIPVECTGLTHIWNVHQSNGQEDVILGGFYGNDYVVVDPINGYEFLRIQTGGRQKRQDFCIDFSNDSYAMAICTGQKDGSNVINFHLSDLLIDETLKSPRVNHRMIDRPYSIGVSYHAETVNDACWVKCRGDQPTYLLSGSNDCSVNLLQFRNGKLISTTKLPPHESCVRGVCSSSHPTTDTSLLVTCGGKLTMEFYLLNHSAVDVDSSLSCLCSYRTVGRGTTIDHRMNAVRAIPLPSDRGYHHFVASGDSEGNLHIVIVSEHSKSRNTTIGEILEGNGRPVLCLELISFNGFVFVAVGTTGGDIQLWAFNITILSGCCNRAEDEFYNLKGVHPTKVCEFKAHQSGVNDMSVAAIPGEENDSDAGKFALLSVGDDQAVSACIISFEKRLEKGQLCCKNIRLSTTSCASASALKSVHVVLDETTFHRVYTTGHDERVTLWEFDAVGISLKYITCVPIGTEGSCLDCFQYTRPDGTLTEVCAVGGAGTELLSINLSALMAACAVRNANFLLITAGAGFSKDSGLTTYEEAPVSYKEMCNPAQLLNNHQRFQQFWLNFSQRYLKTKPHAGYELLDQWCGGGQLPSLTRQSNNVSPWWVYTSNVDGHFARFASFAESLCEIHGNAMQFKCACGIGFANGEPRLGPDWEKWNKEVLLHCKDACSETKVHLNVIDNVGSSSLLLCSHCQLPMRPNVLMFHDTDENVLDSISKQRERYQAWEALVEEEVATNSKSFVVLELGCGTNVPAVREESEEVLRDCAKLTQSSSVNSGDTKGTVSMIRINPKHADIDLPTNESTKMISIYDKAESALKEIDNWLKVLEP